MLLVTEQYCFAQKFCLQNQDIQLKLSEGYIQATKGKSRGRTGYIDKPFPKQFQSVSYPKSKTLDQSPEANDLLSE